jgi:ACS family pantothenate transporter-like MFS transporter
MLTRSQVNAPLYIAFLELSWTVFTFATAGVKDVNQLYIFRFLYVSCIFESTSISNLVAALVYSKPVTSQRSCTCAQATTNLTSWLDAIP